jgi:hypothetical protein
VLFDHEETALTSISPRVEELGPLGHRQEQVVVPVRVVLPAGEATPQPLVELLPARLRELAAFVQKPGP